MGLVMAVEASKVSKFRKQLHSLIDEWYHKRFQQVSFVLYPCYLTLSLVLFCIISHMYLQPKGGFYLVDSGRRGMDIWMSSPQIYMQTSSKYFGTNWSCYSWLTWNASDEHTIYAPYDWLLRLALCHKFW